MSKTIIQEKNEVDNRPPEVNELMQFAESADYKKTKAYYTFMYVGAAEKVGCMNFYAYIVRILRIFCINLA